MATECGRKDQELVINMKVSFRKIRKMEWDSSLGRMGMSTWVSSKMMRGKVREK